ncbi:MAG: hypothetical protein PHU44_00470 [Syntrophales bacterium]|nr:hypothetical protein [Syntrophales bacterium]
MLTKYKTGWIIGLMLIILAVWSVPGLALEFPLNGKNWALWGSTRENLRLNREEAISKENYCPTGGCVIRLDKVSVQPLRARPGDTLLLQTSYTLLTPEKVGIPVTVTRQIFFQGRPLGTTKSMDSSIHNGAYDQEVNFKLPADAKPGVYTLVTVVSTAYGQDQRTIEFRVE